MNKIGDAGVLKLLKNVRSATMSFSTYSII